MKHTKQKILTAHGEDLYRIFSRVSVKELTIEEFAQQILGGSVDAKPATCKFCGNWRKLADGYFCLACISNSLRFS